MLSYPVKTTREEKMSMIQKVKDRLLDTYGEQILAIGVYGSVGRNEEGPFSDIEMHVVTKHGFTLENYEFIYGKFKIELSVRQKSDFFKRARLIDDSWSIKAGVFTGILPLFDPQGLFEEVKEMPMQVPESVIKETMREFMIWEPYETMGKIRNQYEEGNYHYLPMGARDLVWQTAKLIGLANRHIYTTRAKTFEESLTLPYRPEGYRELAVLVMEGTLHDRETVYQHCECLWTGLNEWYEELGITYMETSLPF
ncbi:kanamycin nucleotidyltransferase C-terminal domain-containing protein [Alteribacter keqinensis]|uniref:KNTase domain-containing protein n=1 Tax=Alteribacter keqinensis TaxID=2483800 RepID=A0A3M7TYH2_9BACI|nr:kanamycin nucleotidyltransferase C-terminal domain-containing protein [Alteribacter keqinensis]RNA70636.1 KNTase domain-containing protein [Alteribacter keqinensis]